MNGDPTRRSLSPLDRRAFLAAAGGLFIAACSSGGTRDNGDSDGAVAGLRVSSDLYASSAPQRFAFAVTRGDQLVVGEPVEVAIVAPGLDRGTTVPATFRGEGLEADRGIYTVEAVLPQPGIWNAALALQDRKTALLPFQVAATPAVIVAGQPARRVPSPTRAFPLGTDPLCTRDPDCALHGASLDQLVGQGRPVVAVFATPARCQTNFCGPVLDVVLAQQNAFAARVDFVHVEIYAKATGSQLVPTVQQWNLPSEPWVFGIRGDGTVAARLDGAFDGAEVRELLERSLA